MNIGTITCIVMAVMFLIFSIIFGLLKEKGAILISGFNSISKEKREKYDKSKMSKDMRNLFFVWCILFVIGGVLSHFISQHIAIVFFMVWLILFFREVHFDTEKAFGKYKL
ncbi:MAG: DUF3784 domain-containing protein [Clostridiales bacterium]|nr:DUF3784 domain-containing protein [Clostridiales bacterium]